MDIQKLAGLLGKAEDKFFSGNMSEEAFFITVRAITETAAQGGYTVNELSEANTGVI